MDSLTIHINDLERIMRKWGATPGDWRHFFADLKESSVKSEPDWSVAPEWANWWAQDKDGTCYWYINKPLLIETVWKITGQFQIAGEKKSEDWKASLKQRHEKPTDK